VVPARPRRGSPVHQIHSPKPATCLKNALTGHVPLALQKSSYGKLPCCLFASLIAPGPDSDRMEAATLGTS
jgi:hypothetical protein